MGFNPTISFKEYVMKTLLAITVMTVVVLVLLIIFMIVKFRTKTKEDDATECDHPGQTYMFGNQDEHEDMYQKS